MSPVESYSPKFSTLDAQNLVRHLYKIEVKAEPLASYIDQNFRIHDRAGSRFVLKIANSGEKAEILDMQNQVMRFLNDRTALLGIPRVIPTIHGDLSTETDHSSGTKHFVRLLTYLPGRFLNKIKAPQPELFYEFGRFLGELDRHLWDFTHPAGCRDLPWDLNHAHHIREHLRNIKEPARRRLVDYFLLQFETLILPELSSFRQSIIHNDGNDRNILVEPEPENSVRIAGIIDFGDMLKSSTINELAVAVTYSMMGRTHPIDTACQIIRGYHDNFPVVREELEALFYLIGARLCISVIMSAKQKLKETDNEYITVSEAPAWELLEYWLAVNPEKAARRFCQACGISSKSHGLKTPVILEKRAERIGKNLSVSYQKPLHINRGAMQYLFDDQGGTYLDCVNNVCHLGHCHPAVVRAANRQMVKLNTNTRFLHENLVKYAESLTATLPDPLKVCYIVNSGSEANDLALRMARHYTGGDDTIVIDGAYHGNLTSLIDISPYKFNGPGGRGRRPHIHVTSTPDPYRGPFKGKTQETGKKYAEVIIPIIEQLLGGGKRPPVLIAETLMGCAGQIVFPPGYLKEAYSQVRSAGGVCIADEVQVGFGRVGTHFWGFQTQEVVPDIVTMGKPIGNGHPLAAVVTTPEISRAFHNGMEYFNTFGGNPVSCAVGIASLETIREENLQQNAENVGKIIISGMLELQSRHPLIGDVRGLGLFIGIELVRDRVSLEPAVLEAKWIIEEMKNRGILLSVDGPLENVLKIKPPIIFSPTDGNRVITELDEVLKNGVKNKVSS